MFNISQRRRSWSSTARFAFLLAAASLLVLLLAACRTTTDPDPDPDPDPPGGPLSLEAPSEMNGVTSATVRVGARGAWQLRVEPASADAPNYVGARVSLSRSSGTGSAVVTLTVDPSGLPSDPTGTAENPQPDYNFRLRLEGGGRTATQDVFFSFPDVSGYAMRRVASGDGDGAGDAQGGIPGVVIRANQAAEGALGTQGSSLAASGLLIEDPTGPLLQPGDDRAPDTAGQGGMATLIVGVERAAGQVLGTHGAHEAAGLPLGTVDAAALQSVAAAVSRIAGASLSGRFDEAGLVFVEVPAANADAALRQLLTTRGVRYAEVPEPIYPFSNDEFRHLQWNMDKVKAEQLWTVSDGAGVTIAILDNGFFPDHPDLAGNVVGQYDAGDRKNSVRATNAECGVHGTHVAGIAAAVANNSRGVAGTAPGAKLYLVDLDLENEPGCPMNAATLIRGVNHVLNGGTPRAAIINMSIGTANDLGQGVQDALQAARDAGIILIGASGNSRCLSGQDTFVGVSYPAAYSQVWAVGATDKHDARACYSHIGGELFVVAPGGDSYNEGGVRDTILSTFHDYTLGNHVYGYMEGTSMAAPMVAGVVAMLKGAAPAATDGEIRQAIIDGARDLGAPGFDNLYGHGLVDAVAAYDALTGGEEPPPPPPPPPPVGAMRLTIPGYGVYDLHADGIFTLQNWPVGPVTVTVESDEDGDEIYGEPGEYRGQAQLDVRFNAPLTMVVYLDQVE